MFIVVEKAEGDVVNVYEYDNTGMIEDDLKSGELEFADHVFEIYEVKEKLTPEITFKKEKI